MRKWRRSKFSSLSEGTQLVWSEESNPDLWLPSVLAAALLVVPKLVHMGTLSGSLNTADAWLPLPSHLDVTVKGSQMIGTCNRTWSPRAQGQPSSTGV